MSLPEGHVSGTVAAIEKQRNDKRSATESLRIWGLDPHFFLDKNV
jgi:hypothetical protein